jgi:hypothetical protein
MVVLLTNSSLGLRREHDRRGTTPGAADRGKVQIPSEVGVVEVDQHPTPSNFQLPLREFPQNAGSLPPHLSHLMLLAREGQAALAIIDALLDSALRCRFPCDAMDAYFLSLAPQNFLQNQAE